MKTRSADRQHYEIRVRGHLDVRRSSEFSELTLTLTPEGDTILSARHIDQSSLFGILLRIRDLGVPLLSVTCSDPSCRPEHTGVTR